MNDKFGWIHRFESPVLDRSASDSAKKALTLLLLHGTGGNEDSLIEIGRQVAPAAAILSVRGRSLDEGFPRFFRRFSATSYDQQQLIEEADALAQFTTAAAGHYGLDPAAIFPFGFSNGANIGLASLIRNPQTYAGAVFLRPVMPFDEPPKVELNNIPVLINYGLLDPYLQFGRPIVPYLKKMNGAVTENDLPAGHEITERDLIGAAAWLDESN